MASAEALFSRNISKTNANNGDKKQSNVDEPSVSQVIVDQTNTQVNPPQRATNSYVAFTGEDAERIPSKLWKSVGDTATCLDLSYNQLNTLEGLEHFKNLEELILDNNNLTDAVLIFPTLPQLHTLTMNKNQIEDIQTLLVELEKHCPCLRYLSLLGNRACPNELLQSGHDDEDYQRYRYYVLHHLSELSFLDSRPVTNKERIEAKRVGAFMQVVRPDNDKLEKPDKKKLFSSKSPSSSELVPIGFNPLPASRSVVGQHRGVYGQCKYVYYGKHSEGNRFIRNQHL